MMWRFLALFLAIMGVAIAAHGNAADANSETGIISAQELTEVRTLLAGLYYPSCDVFSYTVGKPSSQQTNTIVQLATEDTLEQVREYYIAQVGPPHETYSGIAGMDTWMLQTEDGRSAVTITLETHEETAKTLINMVHVVVNN